MPGATRNRTATTAVSLTSVAFTNTPLQYSIRHTVES
jgi:hypothetical protein